MSNTIPPRKTGYYRLILAVLARAARDIQCGFDVPSARQTLLDYADILIDVGIPAHKINAFLSKNGVDAGTPTPAGASR